MLLVLVALCALFSLLTLEERMPDEATAAAELVERIERGFDRIATVVCVGAANRDSARLAERVGQALDERGYTNASVVVGTPRDLRLALDAIAADGGELAAVATVADVAKWQVIETIPQRYAVAASFELLVPEPRIGTRFLTAGNLLAIVDRIVVIAVIAIGMTMVIITAGIDLSVGSLIALSAVIGTLIMEKLGGLEAPGWVVLVGFLGGVLACGAVGALGGLIVARFKVAPFITTLSVMMMARGLAFLITGGFSIYQVPDGLTWLGQGRSLGIPNTVLLLAVFYAAAHVFMSHTKLGRYIYAVGGNEEAARLSGVPVGFVIVLVYTVSGLSAGIGGCIQASQINSGTPNMGLMFELYVIAAVVVGGTSLSGGTGRILGTLIGAFIISVIQNGMNALKMESYTQQVVLGGVILVAVLLDKARGGGGVAALLKRKRDTRSKGESA
jgi:ribose transport system permease protein